MVACGSGREVKVALGDGVEITDGGLVMSGCHAWLQAANKNKHATLMPVE
jgi:hypothetical protein